MNTIKLQIQGFHCEACVKLATMKLKKIDGVSAVHVESDGRATLESAREISQEEFSQALTDAGYTAQLL